MKQWRFNSKDKLNLEEIRRYIHEAKIISTKGFAPIARSKKAIESNLWKEQSQNNEQLNSSFLALSKAKQQEYITYIEEAKQLATKEIRINKIKPMVLAKQGLNDKYKKS